MEDAAKTYGGERKTENRLRARNITNSRQRKTLRRKSTKTIFSLYGTSSGIRKSI